MSRLPSMQSPLLPLKLHLCALLISNRALSLLRDELRTSLTENMTKHVKIFSLHIRMNE